MSELNLHETSNPLQPLGYATDGSYQALGLIYQTTRWHIVVETVTSKTWLNFMHFKQSSKAEYLKKNKTKKKGNLSGENHFIFAGAAGVSPASDPHRTPPHTGRLSGSSPAAWQEQRPSTPRPSPANGASVPSVQDSSVFWDITPHLKSFVPFVGSEGFVKANPSHNPKGLPVPLQR
jgi:hypothetical protein